MSDFPAPESWRNALSRSHLELLARYGVELPRPFVTKREKGAYVYDIDGNKYADFSMGGGTVVLGHSDGQLTHYVKNALSTGSSGAFANKFVSRLIKSLTAFADFGRFAWFASETEALTALSTLHPGPAAVNTSRLLSLALRAGLDAETAVPGKHYALSLLEPVEFDRDLSDTDFAAVDAGFKVSCEARSAFRFRAGFMKTLKDADAILAGASLTNGMGGAAVLTAGDVKIAGELPPMPAAVAANEALKVFKRLDYGTFEWPASELFEAVRGSAAVLRETPDADALMRQGVLADGRLVFLSAAHTEHDVKRLFKALDPAKK